MAEFGQRRSPLVPERPWLRALAPAARYILRGAPDAMAASATAFGVAPSSTACRAVVRGERAALWLGPDEQLMIAPAEEADLLGPALVRALAALPHSLVDVSHRQTALSVSGGHAEAILAGYCPLDLDVRAFPVAMCTRTVYSKADIVLWRTEPRVFRVEVWRSFTNYVVGLMSEVASELGA
jgi:sarcosine oxidase, subunit gamma